MCDETEVVQDAGILLRFYTPSLLLSLCQVSSSTGPSIIRRFQLVASAGTSIPVEANLTLEVLSNFLEIRRRPLMMVGTHEGKGLGMHLRRSCRQTQEPKRR